MQGRIECVFEVMESVRELVFTTAGPFEHEASCRLETTLETKPGHTHTVLEQT